MDVERAGVIRHHTHLAKVCDVVADVLMTSAISDYNSHLSLSLETPCIISLVIIQVATLANT
jgi:hypothetical protein